MLGAGLQTTGQVCKTLGCRFYSINYAIAAGHVPEPEKFAGRRIFTAADVKRLEVYFASKRAADAAKAMAKAARQKARGKSK